MRLQPANGPPVFRKLFFGFAELRRMDRPPVAVWLDREYRMEHFVKHQVIEDKARDSRRIKPAVDGDRPVSRVVVPKNGARSARAPAEARDRNTALEIPEVQAGENGIEIKGSAGLR